MKKIFGLLCSLAFCLSVTAGVASTCKADAKHNVEFSKSELPSVDCLEIGSEFEVKSLEFVKTTVLHVSIELVNGVESADIQHYKDQYKIDYGNCGNSIKCFTHILIDKGKGNVVSDLKYSFKDKDRDLVSNVENTKLHTSNSTLLRKRYKYIDRGCMAAKTNRARVRYSVDIPDPTLRTFTEYLV